MRVAALSILLGSVCLVPAAEAASVRYTGTAVVTAKAGTCADYDPVGDRFTVRFRASGIADNGQRSALAFFRSDSAQGYSVNGRFDATFKPATFHVVYDFGDTPPVIPQVRFANQQPATLAATTPFINVVGQIKGYDYMAQCTVTFRMSLVLRP